MATFHTFCDLITPGTDKEGSAQICREKKSVKKSTQGGEQCTWNLRHCTAWSRSKRHCTTSGRSKRSKAGPCPRSSLSRTPAPHLTDKFEFFAVFDCSSVGRAWWLAPGRRPFQLRWAATYKHHLLSSLLLPHWQVYSQPWHCHLHNQPQLKTWNISTNTQKKHRN